MTENTQTEPNAQNGVAGGQFRNPCSAHSKTSRFTASVIPVKEPSASEYSHKSSSGSLGLNSELTWRPTPGSCSRAIHRANHGDSGSSK